MPKNKNNKAKKIKNVDDLLKVAIKHGCRHEPKSKGFMVYPPETKKEETEPLLMHRPHAKDNGNKCGAFHEFRRWLNKNGILPFTIGG